MSRSVPWTLLQIASLWLLAGGCAEQHRLQLDESADAGAQRPDGAALYASHCALCHGAEGQGYAADSADALANPAFLAVASDAFLRRAIERGRPGTSMSAWGEAFGGPLDAAELDALVQTVRAFAAVEPSEVDAGVVTGSASRAKAYYQVKCQSCHGVEGRGGMFMSISNPEFLASASDGYLRRAISEGRPGTPMVGFAGQLPDQIIDDLVLLIRSWQVDPSQPAADMDKPVWPSELVQFPEGDEPGFAEGRYVSVDALHAALDSGNRLIVADARAPSDYIVKHIAGAISVPFYDAQLYVDKLPKDVTLVAYCGCPHAASGALADSLSRNGFTQVKVLDEGYFVWVERGYPVHDGPNP